MYVRIQHFYIIERFSTQLFYNLIDMNAYNLAMDSPIEK